MNLQKQHWSQATIEKVINMKSHAQVVIIGGGSLGVNLMYHLGLEGWTDVVLIEKGELTSGSTWHAAGLCPNFNGNHTLSKSSKRQL